MNPKTMMMISEKKPYLEKTKLIEKKYKRKWSKRFADEVKQQLMKLPRRKK